MPDDRNPNFLRPRLDIQYFRKPRPLVYWIWGASLCCAVLPLVWYGLVFSTQARAAFMAGPVSPPHKLIEQDCKRCHTAWSPAERLVTADASHWQGRLRGDSIRTEGCLECHRNQAGEHHANQVPAHESLSCAACHREHHAWRPLLEISDDVCLRCHADLQVADGTHTFTSAVTGFGVARHPEFAVHRLTDAREPTLKDLKEMSDPGVRDTQGVLARLDARQTSENSWTWSDRSRLGFTHAKHIGLDIVASDGTLKERNSDRPRNDSPTRARVEASCRHCHAVEADGRYMQPIVFEAHCRGCHPLRADLGLVANAWAFAPEPIPKPDLSSRETELLTRRLNHVEVPHEVPPVIRGFLIDALTARTRTVSGVEATPLPGPARPASEMTETEIVDALRRFERTLFAPEAKAGCQFCHVVREPPAGLGSLAEWTIEPPGIPDRWMPHSRFRHDSHQSLSCVSCHQGIAEFKGSPADSLVTKASTTTADVNLPRLEQCAQCHSEADPNHVSDSSARPQPVPTNCINCHVYHARK